MPIFEYVCKQCRQRFEAIVLGSKQAECPSCHGSDLARQHSTFAVSSKSGSLSAAELAGACGACGDPRGPGACSLN